MKWNLRHTKDEKNEKMVRTVCKEIYLVPNVCVINTYATTEDGTELHAKAVCVVKAKRMLKPHEADHLKWELVRKQARRPVRTVWKKRKKMVSATVSDSWQVCTPVTS